MPHPKLLNRKATALVVVDFQEAFRPTVPDFDLLAGNIANAVRGFQILDIPVLITEQYPKGLGRTAKEILSVVPGEFKIIEKTAFSSCGAIEFLEEIKAGETKQVVICGLESHICVNQTAHDLLDEGFEVHVLEDAVGSRREVNKQTGLRKMRLSGALPSCVEMAMFELIRDSKHRHFKAIQSLIK